MLFLVGVVFLSGAYPLHKAFRANGRTSLRPTLWWAAAAWASWGLVILVAILGDPMLDLNAGRFLALSLTGCAGVAVLGARRPGVGAWNFVVLGLLAVLLLPLAERLVLGQRPLDWLRLVFVAGTLLVIVLNYLPTRLGLAAWLLAAGCGYELFFLVNPEETAPMVPAGWLALALVPWVALVSWRSSRRKVTAFDRTWRDFRDRYGLVWAQRIRDQFNRAAHHAGWSITLGWGGLRSAAGNASPEAAAQEEVLNTLTALLKRFGPPG